MISEYLINMQAFAVLEQVKRTPNIRKRKLYHSPQALKTVNLLLEDGYLRILHPTYNSSSVSITGSGQAALDGLWAAAKATGKIDLYKKEIDDRILRNEAAASSRDESSKNSRRKTMKYDPNLYILKDGEFVPRDEYYASVGKKE